MVIICAALRQEFSRKDAWGALWKINMRHPAERFAGLKIIQPQVFGDRRGFFFEVYQRRRFADLGTTADFVQDNLSRSSRGILRGLHYQLPNPQAKLCYVVRGEVFDVFVDLRRDSETFGDWGSVILSDENHTQILIPPGFAHGFCVLSEVADFCYKCTDFYRPDAEHTIRWDDPDLAIEWPIDGPQVSDKDRDGLALKNAPTYLESFPAG